MYMVWFFFFFFSFLLTACLGFLKVAFCLKYFSWVCIPDVYSHFRRRHLKTDWNLCLSREVNSQPLALVSVIFRSFFHWASDFSSLRNLSILRLRVWLLTFQDLSRETTLSIFSIEASTFPCWVYHTDTFTLKSTVFSREAVVLSFSESRRWIFDWRHGGSDSLAS